MSKKSDLSEGLDQLAALIPNGELLAATNPIGFCHAVIAELISLRAALDAEKPLVAVPRPDPIRLAEMVLSDVLFEACDSGFIEPNQATQIRNAMDLSAIVRRWEEGQ